MHWLWVGAKRRRELINQPNENIPTDTKTSYNHMNAVGGEGGKRWGEDAGMRWGTVGAIELEVIKRRNEDGSEDESGVIWHAGEGIMFTSAVWFLATDLSFGSSVQDLACLFEIYLEPLQNETFLTLDEVGGDCVCVCVGLMASAIRGVCSKACPGRCRG